MNSVNVMPDRDSCEGAESLRYAIWGMGVPDYW